MNYRHAFHAGNFADVVKHVALARIIEHLEEKPTPFRVVDLHAGAGLYDLTGEAAQRTGELAQDNADTLASLAAARRLPKTLRAELTVRRADRADRLNGCGLILVNPPWRLPAELSILMPARGKRLADKARRLLGGTRLEWLVEEKAAAWKRNAGPEGRGPAGGERSA